MVQDNEKLTEDDLVWLRSIQIPEQPEMPQDLVHGDLRAIPLVSVAIPSLLTRARLSPATRAREEARLAAKERAQLALKSRKPTTARGNKHWKRKLQTKKRDQADAWAHRPFSCILARRGWKNIDQQEFKEKIEPLWDLYDPQDLILKWHYRAGREYPVTMKDIAVVQKSTGKLLFRGSEQLAIDKRNRLVYNTLQATTGSSSPPSEKSKV